MRHITHDCNTYFQAPGSLVLVAGATGGVGQLVTAKLLEKGFRVRALTRGDKATIFGDVGGKEIEVRVEILLSSLMVICGPLICCYSDSVVQSSHTPVLQFYSLP